MHIRYVGRRPAARRLRLVSFAVVLGLSVGACSSSSASSDAPTALRLGYFPTITHATAIVGVREGIFARALGTGVRLETAVFGAGPEAVTALFSDALDAAYIGPGPAINAYARSHGEAIRIISGATSGGAFFVVKASINSASDLRGKQVASPQLGNTQDVALRSWLASKGLRTKLVGGGDVSVVNQENAQTLDAFKAGAIDGAWVPEPWASRLVLEGGGKVLVDERDLWPSGRYVTTQLVVRTVFLREHPDVVESLLRGHVEANDFVNAKDGEAKVIVGDALAEITGKHLDAAVIERAWRNLVFTNDPIASSLRASARAAATLGLIDAVDLGGLYDLSLLNKILEGRGRPQIETR